MCGVLFYSGKTFLDSQHHALSSVAHRGPDAAGMSNFQINEKYLSLGHRRLAIIDLDPISNQPMTYQESDKWISFNGEIYNYLELRNELKAKGFNFKTNSDTEVLLAAY